MNAQQLAQHLLEDEDLDINDFMRGAGTHSPVLPHQWYHVHSERLFIYLFQPVTDSVIIRNQRTKGVEGEGPWGVQVTLNEYHEVVLIMPAWWAPHEIMHKVEAPTIPTEYMAAYTSAVERAMVAFRANEAFNNQ